MVFQHEDVRQGGLTVIFVSCQKILSLNKRYLNHDYATDVIAFDLSSENLSVTRKGKKLHSIQGDIFISTDAAMKNAAIFGSTPGKELFLYIVHGILHLLGYDDHEATDIKKIRLKEAKIMEYIGKKAEKILIQT